jgi:hypothetical protein
MWLVNILHDVVRAEIRDRFEAGAAAQVVSALDASPLPFLGADRDHDRARVHLAILKLADGDMGRFQQALALAQVDWRDVLVAAGLGDADWPLVLRATGWRAP